MDKIKIAEELYNTAGETIDDPTMSLSLTSHKVMKLLLHCIRAGIMSFPIISLNYNLMKIPTLQKPMKVGDYLSYMING